MTKCFEPAYKTRLWLWFVRRFEGEGIYCRLLLRLPR